MEGRLSVHRGTREMMLISLRTLVPFQCSLFSQVYLEPVHLRYQVVRGLLAACLASDAFRAMTFWSSQLHRCRSMGLTPVHDSGPIWGGGSYGLVSHGHEKP